MLLEHQERTPSGHSPDGSPAEGHDYGVRAGFDVAHESSAAGIDGSDRGVSLGVAGRRLSW
jgi:hypothetical protein